MASEPDIGEFLSFDARAVCSGSVGNVTDTVTGAYVQVIVDEITSGDGLAVGDELAIWTTVSLTGAPGQRLLKGTNFHFEAEWKELSCFGPCPGMVSHEETNID